MCLEIKLLLTAIAGLGTFALLQWAAMSSANGMAGCRLLLLTLASSTCTIVTIGWASHQLEMKFPEAQNPPNAELRGAEPIGEVSLSNAGFGVSADPKKGE